MAQMLLYSVVFSVMTLYFFAAVHLLMHQSCFCCRKHREAASSPYPSSQPVHPRLIKRFALQLLMDQSRTRNEAHLLHQVVQRKCRVFSVSFPSSLLWRFLYVFFCSRFVPSEEPKMVSFDKDGIFVDVSVSLFFANGIKHMVPTCELHAWRRHNSVCNGPLWILSHVTEHGVAWIFEN